ncbi:MAG: 2-C-methyl-D-erythritol 2,4-cyclodiphosphate synthase [Clostridiales bacterium]|nr:2-C-methyl-D-erythritol 2,4-cyclodiphosphate synthase [Clostridiales bacterium]
MSEKVYVILLAGGSGTRMGAGTNKILLPVAGTPCIARSAAVLAPFADLMAVVCRPGEEPAVREALQNIGTGTRLLFVPGGNTRQRSVLQGIRAIRQAAEEDGPLLIHDGARCMVDPEVVRGVLDSVRTRGSGVASVPVTDTLRKGDLESPAGEIVPREIVRGMQTPQGAMLSVMSEAYERAEREGIEGTDDASLLAAAGFPVFLTQGSRFNLKLTTKEDLTMAESILSAREGSCFPAVRVGQGYDVHQLVEGRRLVLCGVEIPWELGLLGHSDADVALHALMDALLGAAALGDIGRHFPDSDDRYKGIDSMKLLNVVVELLRAAGFRPANVDVTIVAQKPKLAPYIPRMTENLASALSLPLSRVNVKATTTEKLGFEGRMEGISAQAVCLIQEV